MTKVASGAGPSMVVAAGVALAREGKAAAAMATGRSELLNRVGRSKAGSSGGEGDDGATAAVSTAAATRDGRMGTAGWATAMEATAVAPSEATAPAATTASAVADLIPTTRQVAPQSPRHAAGPARWHAKRLDESGDSSSIRGGCGSSGASGARAAWAGAREPAPTASSAWGARGGKGGVAAEAPVAQGRRRMLQGCSLRRGARMRAEQLKHVYVRMHVCVPPL